LQQGGLDCEINILRDIVDGWCDLDCIKLTNDDSDNIATPIEHRPAAVTGLLSIREMMLQERGIAIPF
jgi:hypothetical protein